MTVRGGRIIHLVAARLATLSKIVTAFHWSKTIGEWVGSGGYKSSFTSTSGMTNSFSFGYLRVGQGKVVGVVQV